MTTLAQLLSEYVRQNPRSSQLFERAQAALPGGNTRTGVYVDPFPLYMRSGRGAYTIDVDGNKRLDFINNATALILGHAHRDRINIPPVWTVISTLRHGDSTFLILKAG